MSKKGKLFFLSGKMGAGKSTYAIKLSKNDGSVLLSEDQILSQLYPNEVNRINDYISYSLRVKPFVKWLVQSYIMRGIDVVMDFPGNTIKQRQWFKELILDTNADHSLIYLKVDDDICLEHLDKRRLESPERHKFDTKEVYFQMKSYFQEPSSNEGFNLIIVE